MICPDSVYICKSSNGQVTNASGKEEVESMNCENDTNTIKGILKTEKIFGSKEWKIPTRFPKFWNAFKPWYYYLLEL